MIGAGATQLGGELRAAACGQLVRMQVPGEPGALSSLQRRAALGGRERALLEKGVAAPRSLPRRLGRQLGDDLLHPAPALHPGRDRVEAEERRHHSVAQRAGEPQQPQLVRDREPVAGLHLDGGDAALDEPSQAAPRRGEQLLVGCRARGQHRAADAAARLGDLQIARARQPQRVFVRAVAGEDQMRVGIDEAGREQHPAGVDLLSRRRLRGEPDVRDALAFAGDRAALDQPQRRVSGRCLRAGHGGDAGVAQDQHQRVIPGIDTPRSRAISIARS